MGENARRHNVWVLGNDFHNINDQVVNELPTKTLSSAGTIKQENIPHYVQHQYRTVQCSIAVDNEECT